MTRIGFSPSARKGCAGAAFALTALLAASACERAPRRDAVAAEGEDARYAATAFAYARYCALCHGPNADGYAADNAPSLRNPTFLASASNAFIERGIREGRPGTAMAAYGKKHGGPLEDEEIARMVDFLRGGVAAPPALPKITPVGNAVRGETLFAEHCQTCHGTRTERATAIQLSNPVLLASASDAFLRHAVVNGRPLTPMPSFGGSLPERDIDDVLAAVRSWAAPPPRHRGHGDPPPLGQFIIHPEGQAPAFEVKKDRYVSIKEVNAALVAKKRMIIIDARATSDWYGSHIPGSISVPYYAFERLDLMPKDGTWILAYCACPHHASGVVVDELRKRGYANTAVIDEGILAWRRAGYPVESEPLPPEGSPR